MQPAEKQRLLLRKEFLDDKPAVLVFKTIKQRAVKKLTALKIKFDLK